MTDTSLVEWLRHEGYVQSADEVEQLILSKAALQTEIERLRGILDGTERRECEYLALIEKKHLLLQERNDEVARLRGNNTKLESENERLKAGQDWQRGEIERLKAERHTVKRMLQDLLEKHDPGHRPQLTLIGKPPSG